MLADDDNLSAMSRQDLDARIARAMDSGLRYLVTAQQRDGSWLSLWSGDQRRPQQDNPVIGTSCVLVALRDLDRLDSPPPQRALDWLLSAQHADGSFGGGAMNRDLAALLPAPPRARSKRRPWRSRLC